MLSTLLPTRTSIQRNVLKIQHMHERFLSELRSVIPDASGNSTTNIPAFFSRDQYARWGRLDQARLTKSSHENSSCRNIPASVEARIRSSRPWAAEPSEAADVARILNKMVASPKLHSGLKFRLLTYTLVTWFCCLRRILRKV